MTSRSAMLLFLLLPACLGSGVIKRSYYVLKSGTVRDRDQPPIEGLVRVRNLDAASAYEKFQIVVRRSPFQLSYSEADVWAVKPNRMVSDVIAEGLARARQFMSVVRELGDLRPDYILSGDLHAVEVYDSGDVWYAHLALILQLSKFDTGETLLTYKFDDRKHVPSRNFSHAARALSELLSTALDELVADLNRLEVARATDPDAQAPPGSIVPVRPGERGSTGTGELTPEEQEQLLEQPPGTIFVPARGAGERPPEEEPDEPEADAAPPPRED